MVRQWLSAPIPRRNALASVLAVELLLVVQSYRLGAHMRLIEHQNTSLHICNEIIDTLLDKADPQTVHELNEQLEFWRVIRGVG